MVNDLENYLWDEKKEFPKYHIDSKVKHKYTTKPVINTEVENYDWKEWKVTPDIEDNNFVPFAKRLLEELGSLLLNGRAGVGKSTMIKIIIELLKDKNCVCLAPTNKAANIIGVCQLRLLFYQEVLEEKTGGAKLD